jgi:DNA polymerase
MKNLSIDLETFSSADLFKCGVYKYAESPDFEILLFGYAVDDEETQVVDLASGEKLPSGVVTAIFDVSVIKWALFKEYNARDVDVERAIKDKLLKYPVPESEWQHYILDQQINDRGNLAVRSQIQQ